MKLKGLTNEGLKRVSRVIKYGQEDPKYVEIEIGIQMLEDLSNSQIERAMKIAADSYFEVELVEVVDQDGDDYRIMVHILEPGDYNEPEWTDGEIESQFRRIVETKFDVECSLNSVEVVS